MKIFLQNLTYVPDNYEGESKSNGNCIITWTKMYSTTCIIYQLEAYNSLSRMRLLERVNVSLHSNRRPYFKVTYSGLVKRSWLKNMAYSDGPIDLMRSSNKG